ncbi:MAG: fluoride efflux transporter CrcB [Pyrinomonadaceae bacterium]|nr:fluoride efflux transporter CrcB [Pyrinomonadaceae bacterium]
MEFLTKILAVAFGGAFGATARYLINISPLAVMFGKFPFHTFLINVSGSFLIGFLLIVFTDKFTANENLRLALTVGFLGAFTTFSTFEMEIYELIRERFFVTAFFYLSFSILIGLVGVAAGVWLGKKI